MANANKKRRRKRPSSRHFRINVATVIAIVIFAYLAVRTFVSFTKPTISTYEVTAQQINDKISTIGLALRTEQVVNTSQAGYIIYYVSDGERVGLNSNVYAIDGSGTMKNQLVSEEGDVVFSDDNYVDIKNQIIDYKSIYKDASFGSLYDFKYALDNNIIEITNDSVISKMDELMDSGSGISRVKAQATGVVSYCYDGLEGLTTNDLAPSYFEDTDNKMIQMRNTDIYKLDTPVYRVVTDENWQLAVELTEEQYERIKDMQFLTIKFLKDDLTVERGVTFLEQNNSYFAVLSFNKYMQRYMDERYLDIDIILNSLDGLKIPNSSLIKEKLYAIPTKYAVETDEAVSGVAFNLKTYDKDGKEKATTITPPICYYDEGQDMYYVSGVDVSKGDVLVANASDKDGSIQPGEEYVVSETKEFEGVFTINKGYAQFVVISNLYQADDFCIVRASTKYGINQYDHIILDSSSIKEGQIIY